MTHSPPAQTQCTVQLTKKTWEEIQEVAKQYQLSVPEFLAKIGQKKLAVIDSEELEDYLDLQDALEAEAREENQERISWEQIKQELGL